MMINMSYLYFLKGGPRYKDFFWVFIVPYNGNCIKLSFTRVNWRGRTQVDKKYKQNKANTHHVTRPYGQMKPYLKVGSAPLLKYCHSTAWAQCWILSARESKSPLLHFSETVSVGQAVFIMCILEKWGKERKRGINIEKCVHLFSTQHATCNIFSGLHNSRLSSNPEILRQESFFWTH